jgi:hypothetical protein
MLWPTLGIPETYLLPFPLLFHLFDFLGISTPMTPPVMEGIRFRNSWFEIGQR